MWKVIGAIFGWFFGLFTAKSEARQLGAAETAVATQAQTLKEVQEVHDEQTKVAAMDDAALRLHTKQWQRHDS